MKRKKDQTPFPKVQPEDLLAAKEQVYERCLKTREERDAVVLVGRTDIVGIFTIAYHSLVNQILGNGSIEDTMEQLAGAAIYVLASMTVARDHNQRTGKIQIVRPGEDGAPE